MKMNISWNDLLDYTIRNTSEIGAECEMSNFDSAFLCGLLKYFRPKNIMEVGVAKGGTSALILQAIDFYKLDANLDSFDFNTYFYKDNTQLTGYIAKDKYPDAKNWQLITGNYLPQLLGDSTKKYDFIILDTVHSLPGEVLDYLVAIQYASQNAVIVLHDYHIYMSSQTSYAISNKLLFDSAVGEKIIFEDQENPFRLPNICAIRINPDTFKYIINTFLILSLNWVYLISKTEYDIYRKFFQYYYDTKLVTLFDIGYLYNKNKIHNDSTIEYDIKKMVLSICNNNLLKETSYGLYPIFDKEYNWCFYPISDNNEIHYEFLISNKSFIIALHFEGTSRKYFDFYQNLSNLSHLSTPLQLVNSSNCTGCQYVLNDYTDFVGAVLHMKYLIKISLPILNDLNLVYTLLN